MDRTTQQRLPGGGILACSLCGVPLYSDVEIQEHVNSRSHLDMVVMNPDMSLEEFLVPIVPEDNWNEERRRRSPVNFSSRYEPSDLEAS